MIVRRWAEFTTDLPDDAIEGDGGFIQWPGKNIAEALAEILAGMGCTDIRIVDLEHAGYDVGFKLGKRALSARVTIIGKPLIGFDKKHQPEYFDFLKQVNAEFAKDGRFHDVRWFTDDEVLTGAEGAMSPLAAPPKPPPPLDKASTRSSMNVRPWIAFASDLPSLGSNDQDENGVYEIPGYSVAQAISSMLVRCGCKAIRTVYRPDIGWNLYFRAGKHRVAARVKARVNLTDKYQVHLWQRSWMAKTFGREAPEYVEVLRRLNIELAKDPRFQDVRWFFEQELHSGFEGALSPVEEPVGSYAKITPQIERWASKHSLILNSAPWNGKESRAVWLSSEAGECFQIWIEAPSSGVVKLHAAGVDSRRDDEPPRDWIATVDQVEVALEAAYEAVLDWMHPSKHFHPRSPGS